MSRRECELCGAQATGPGLCPACGGDLLDPEDPQDAEWLAEMRRRRQPIHVSLPELPALPRPVRLGLLVVGYLALAAVSRPLARAPVVLARVLHGEVRSDRPGAP